MNLLTKANSVKATFGHVSTRIRPLPAVATTSITTPKVSNKTKEQKQDTRLLPYHAAVATYGITGVLHQVRYYHGDVKVPSFDDHRRERDKDPNKSYNLDQDDQAKRKLVSYLFLTGGLIPGMYASKGMIRGLAASLGPDADSRAKDAIKIEVDLSKIPEGNNITVKYRGKPLFIRHRTAREINKEASVELSKLRDPEHDHDRVVKPEFLVVVGVCTHLGCVPIAFKGAYNGYYCPCHGSHYDASGRIRKGPAPKNLEVPNYEYVTDEVILIG